jgi:DNA-binding beta-propeller fold protein YncE
MKAFFVLSLCFLATFASAQSTLQQYQVAARDAYKSKDYKKFKEMILEAHKLHPFHQGILYQTGLAYALNDEPKESIKYLKQAIQIKADYDLATTDLQSLNELPDFEDLKKLQVYLLKPIVNSDTAFIIHQKDLHIEAVAAGEKKNVFYLGSIHKRKIIRSDAQGNISDFTTTAQDGLTCVFGIKVDTKKNLLWACASPFPIMENFDSTATSGIFKYDLKSKKLLTRFVPPDKREYAFGDLTLDNAGNPFISDSKNSTIFTVDQANGKLVEFYKSDQFWSLQGITFSDDGKYLFIADYVKGIFRLTMESKKLIQLTANFDESLKSIDGMTFHNKALIAIQNLVTPMRATLYKLNDSMDVLTSFNVIDRGHPAFNEPTIGCISDNIFYYVANSLWSGYTPDNKLKPQSELQDVVILKFRVR